MDRPDYHTALHGETTDAFPRDWWSEDGNLAFVYDFTAGTLPPEFAEVDVLYGEIPWKDGFEEFNHRAGLIDAPSYEQSMYRLNCALAGSGKPWMIVGGAAGARCIGGEWMRRIDLNGSVACVKGARMDAPPPEVKCAEALLGWVTSNPFVERVGDFCAGYGATAKAAVLAGKQFVATDYNAQCIGHIADAYGGWNGH